MKKNITYGILILTILSASFFAAKYYNNLHLTPTAPETKLFCLTFVLGLTLAMLFYEFTMDKIEASLSAYKRQLEKESIGCSENSSKVQVLESKIAVLEKALDDALNK